VLKAGVLEIADVFVVNKADHPMALQHSGLEARGVADLWEAIVAHDAWPREPR
jgi:putative protein kinase ArgK-like GTPase of G3E family